METFTFAFFEGANIRWTIFWCPTPFSRRNLVSSCERASAFWPRSCLRGRAWVLKSVPYLKKTFRNFVASSRVDKTWSGIATIGLSSSSTDQVFTHTSVCTPTYLTNLNSDAEIVVAENSRFSLKFSIDFSSDFCTIVDPTRARLSQSINRSHSIESIWWENSV